jgi:hypothetical protein
MITKLSKGSVAINIAAHAEVLFDTRCWDAVYPLESPASPSTWCTTLLRCSCFLLHDCSKEPPSSWHAACW